MLFLPSLIFNVPIPGGHLVLLLFTVPALGGFPVALTALILVMILHLVTLADFAASAI